MDLAQLPTVLRAMHRPLEHVNPFPHADPAGIFYRRQYDNGLRRWCR